MKHISAYSREEIIKCLKKSGLRFDTRLSTEALRKLLDVAIQNGDAPEIEQL